MRIVLLALICIWMVGCMTSSAVTSKLSLGMTKQEVLEKCGKPTQAGAIKDKDGRTLESFNYREAVSTAGGLFSVIRDIDTYVYFSDGRVIYYGSNPTMPTEQQATEKQ